MSRLRVPLLVMSMMVCLGAAASVAAADEWEHPALAEAPVRPSGQRLFSGPLMLRNDSPLYLTLMTTALPDRATTLAPTRWAWEAGYLNSNSIVDQNNLAVTDRVIIDAELQRFEVSVKHGVADRWEAGASLSYLALGGGYMDGFIDSFEDAFGFTTPRARRIRSEGEFRYLVRVNGQNLIDETDETIHGLGDLPLYLKYQFRDEVSGWAPRMATRLTLKLPTATERLLGNRRVDVGAGFLAEQPIGDRWLLLANLDLTTAHAPTRIKTIDLDPVVVSSTWLIEYFLTDRASLKAQYAIASNPYPEFDKDMTVFNRLPMGIGVGWTYRLPKARVTLGASENVNSAWPDFSWTASFNGEF